MLTRATDSIQTDDNTELLKEQMEKLNLNTNRRVSLTTNRNNFQTNGHSIVNDNLVDQFNLNDLVQLSSDAELMKIIQKGHGEWAEAMHQVSRIYTFHFFE